MAPVYLFIITFCKLLQFCQQCYQNKWRYTTTLGECEW